MRTKHLLRCLLTIRLMCHSLRNNSQSSWSIIWVTRLWFPLSKHTSNLTSTTSHTHTHAHTHKHTQTHTHTHSLKGYICLGNWALLYWVSCLNVICSAQTPSPADSFKHLSDLLSVSLSACLTAQPFAHLSARLRYCLHDSLHICPTT